MDEEKNVQPEELNNQEEEETSKNDEQQEEEKEEEKDYKQLYENQKIRAEKAEKAMREQKQNKPVEKEKETPKNDLTALDAAKLMEAKVPTDDWEDVIDYAKFKGISIGEAIKSSVVKATLAEKSEERKSSSVIDTNKKRGGTHKIDGFKLLEKAEKTGEMPESDEEINALIEAREKRKRG